MFSSVINIRFKPERLNDGVAFARSVTAKLEGVPGIREFTVISTGDDGYAVFVIYNSKDEWEAAGPKAQELLGGLADMVAAAPERTGGEVLVNHVY